MALTGVVFHQTNITGFYNLRRSVTEPQFRLAGNYEYKLTAGAVVPTGHGFPAKYYSHTVARDHLFSLNEGEVKRICIANFEFFDVGLAVVSGIDTKLHPLTLSILPKQ
jgi:hypothetical protein